MSKIYLEIHKGEVHDYISDVLKMRSYKEGGMEVLPRTIVGNDCSVSLPIRIPIADITNLVQSRFSGENLRRVEESEVDIWKRALNSRRFFYEIFNNEENGEYITFFLST